MPPVDAATPGEKIAGLRVVLLSLNAARDGNDAGRSTGVDVDFVFLDTPAARDQLDQAADVSADIAHVCYGKSVLQISADEFFFVHGDDLQVFVVVAFEILAGAGGWVCQIILKRFGDFQAHEQPLGRFIYHAPTSAFP